MHTPKVGDRFSLLGMEWEVVIDGERCFRATATSSNDKNIYLLVEDASKLDWFKPTPKISREARDYILNHGFHREVGFEQLLDSMTE
ncbi:MAG: hypothetical protein WC763_05320 [Candidatus Paceibacterota bacterium]|jgi:hypothetical protein